MYNSASIYLGTSLSEGWGLTISEAMQCGCAVVTTDIEGVKDFANESTVLFYQPQNVEELVEKISELLHNEERRNMLARCSYLSIQKFTWENSISKLLEVLEL